MNFRTEDDLKTRFEYAAHLHERGNTTAWIEKTLKAASPTPPKGWKKKQKK
jgi:hypothetical protein